MGLNIIKFKLRQSQGKEYSAKLQRQRAAEADARVDKLRAQVESLQDRIKLQIAKRDKAYQAASDADISSQELHNEARLLYTADIEGPSEDKAAAWEAYCNEFYHEEKMAANTFLAVAGSLRSRKPD